MNDDLEQETGLDSMTKAELKAEARARGLSTTGTKAALLERVDLHDSEAEGDFGPQGAGQSGDDQDETRARRNGEPEPSAEEERGEPEASAEEERDEPEPSAEEERGEPELSAEEERGEPEPSAEQRGNGHRAPHDLADVASSAAQALAELTGRTVDAVSGMQRTDDSYVVTIEVLELSRVPSTTDVLATYEVRADPDGSVTGYSRVQRYYRNQTSRE